MIAKLLELQTEMHMPLWLAPERKILTLASQLERQVKHDCNKNKGKRINEEWAGVPAELRPVILAAFARATQDHAKKLLKKL